MINTIANESVTAADPISLALPDNTCNSVLTRSVNASIAEFNNSTISITNSELTNIAQCSNDEASQNEIGNNIRLNSSSCLNAASSLNAALKPR